MINEEITEFAKILVQNVRDSAIKSCDTRLSSNNSKSPIAKRWQKAKESGDITKFGETIISDCVDDAIFYFLEAIDQELLNLSLNGTNNKAINLVKEGGGELSGWYAGEWIAKYSKQRYTNDFSNIG